MDSATDGVVIKQRGDERAVYDFRNKFSFILRLQTQSTTFGPYVFI